MLVDCGGRSTVCDYRNAAAVPAGSRLLKRRLEEQVDISSGCDFSGGEVVEASIGVTDSAADVQAGVAAVGSGGKVRLALQAADKVDVEPLCRRAQVRACQQVH